MPRKPGRLEQANATQVDDFYAALLAVHEGLSTEQSQRLNARLVLLLANEIGSLERIEALLEEARQSLLEQG